jgi:transmembrane sensor
MSYGRLEQFEQDCDAALGWIARFRSGSVSDADRQAFALWLHESPAHRRAMDRMQDLWDDLGALQHLPEPALEQLAAPARRHWLGAAVALAASVVLALFLLPQLQAPVSTEQYQTALGERRSIALEDGSEITLNTNSRISVRLTAGDRQVVLKRGEAFFRVSPDPDRPFHVDTGATRVTVVGTAFNIHRHNEYSSDITVAEGVVKVSEREPPATRAPATEILRARERLQTSREGFAASAEVDLTPLLAWRRGELVARGMPLAALVAEMGRYQTQHILIADPRVATLPVSGVFQLDHPDSILQALERSLDLQVVRLDDNTLQLRAVPQ